MSFHFNYPFEICSHSVTFLPAISCLFSLIFYILFFHWHIECDSSITSQALGHVISDRDDLWYKLIANFTASTQLPSSPVYHCVLWLQINFLYIKNLFIIFCLLEINILIKLHACAYLVFVSKKVYDISFLNSIYFEVNTQYATSLRSGRFHTFCSDFSIRPIYFARLFGAVTSERCKLRHLINRGIYIFKDMLRFRIERHYSI